MTLLSMISRSSVDRAPAREVMGSIPVGDSEFFFDPHSCHVDEFIILIKFLNYQKMFPFV